MRAVLVPIVVQRSGERAGQPVECDVGEDVVERGVGVGPDQELFADPRVVSGAWKGKGGDG